MPLWKAQLGVIASYLVIEVCDRFANDVIVWKLYHSTIRWDMVGRRVKIMIAVMLNASLRWKS